MSDFSDFWHQRCPARGPSEQHSRLGHCPNVHQPPHAYDQCCHCERRASHAMTYPQPIDIEEPRMTTAKDGSGALSDAERSRLVFYVDHVRPRARIDP